MQIKTPKRFRQEIETARAQVETVIGVLARHSAERDRNLGPEFTKAIRPFISAKYLSI